MRFTKLIGMVLLSFFIFGTALDTSFKTAEAAEIKYINYMVEQNETLPTIAKKFQIGKDEIVAVNPKLQTSEKINAGEVIVIPDLSELKKLQEKVVRLTNIKRKKKGLAPLKSNWELSKVARYKTNDMRDNNYFSHYSPTYGDPFVMLKDFGVTFTTAGENIGCKQITPKQVVKAWMKSESHRNNILNPAYTEIGVGYAEGGMAGYYWTQMFISK